MKQKELALWLCRLGPGDLDEVIGYVKALASRVEDHEEKHEVRSFEEGLGFMLGAGTPFISSDVSDVLSELSGMVSVTALREHYLRVYPHLDPEV